MSERIDWAALEDDDKRWIAAEIHRLLPGLRDKRHRAWANKLIDNLLWFWTADAVHPHGYIRRDAIKTDPRHVHHTDAALESLVDGIKSDDDKVQHEHAGERAEIIKVLDQQTNPSIELIVEILEHLNVAVLVTRQEHRDLEKVEWDSDWRKRDWRARYSKAKLKINAPSAKK